MNDGGRHLCLARCAVIYRRKINWIRNLKVKRKTILAIVGAVIAWLLLFNLPFNTPLSTNAQAMFDEYHSMLADSPVVAKLQTLETLVVESERLCDTSTSDCLEWLRAQNLQSIQAEDLARAIIAADNFALSHVYNLEEPFLPYSGLYRGIQSYFSRVLNQPELWQPLVADIHQWCNQQMDLVGYIVCIGTYEHALNLGDYLIAQGQLQLQPLAALNDKALRNALIGEWVFVNTYAVESLEKQSLGWKYWLLPKLARMAIINPNRMVNTSALEIQQVLRYLNGENVSYELFPCINCGFAGNVLHQVSTPNLTAYIDRHRALQHRLGSFGNSANP